MEKLKVEQVIISKQAQNSENFQIFKEIVSNKKIKTTIVRVDIPENNPKIYIEKDIYLDILWPNNKNAILDNPLNNNSIVCKLCYKSFSMLFTGDIEEIAERKILEEYKNKLDILNSTILKVAHHGSNTSSTQEFLNIVKPKIALIGVGKNNKFGHPNKEVLERLKTCGCIIYRTDKMGEITIVVNKKIKINKVIE